MANVAHSSLTGSNLHENKGVSSATDNTVATASSGATVWAKLTASNLTGTGNAFGAQLLHVRNQQTAGTSSGETSTTSWAKRTLNTSVTNEISSATLTSSVISLPAGTYYIKATTPFTGNGSVPQVVKTRLRNTTDSSTVLQGGSVQLGIGDSASTCGAISMLEGRFTLSGTKNLELQAYSSSSCNVVSGIAGAGEVEVYTEVYIWKVA